MLMGRKERQKGVCNLFLLIIRKRYFVEYKHCIWETSYLLLRGVDGRARFKALRGFPIIA